jgi:hypothetical protein
MWQVRLRVDDELDGLMAPSSDAVPRTTRESPVLATTMRYPYLTMDSAVQSLWTASKWRLRWSLPYTATHVAHVGRLPDVELGATKLLLVVDERCQHERLLLLVFVQVFQVRNMDLSLALVYENNS